jgi:hypothetical protein
MLEELTASHPLAGRIHYHAAYLLAESWLMDLGSGVLGKPTPIAFSVRGVSVAVGYDVEEMRRELDELRACRDFLESRDTRSQASALPGVLP